MIQEEPFPNAFAAFGLVPDKYGRRTVVEHRAALVNVDETPGRVEETVTQLRNTVGQGVAEVLDRRFLVPIRPELPGYTPQLPSVDESDTVAKRMWTLVRGGELHVPPMKVIDWHWADERLAIVAQRGTAVAVYDVKRGGLERPRVDSRVREIRCLQWRPCTKDTIALGCKDGVAIWNGAYCTVWRCSGHNDVVDLSWSSDGARLVTAAVGDESVRLWDAATASSCKVSLGGVVKFAPTVADTLFVGALRRAAFRLWRADSWAVERWGFLAGPPVAVAWWKDRVIIAASGENALHVLKVRDGGNDGATVTEVLHTEFTAVPEIGPGGCARSIAWDPTGERVAVAFQVEKDERKPFVEGGWDLDEKRRCVVALYATNANVKQYSQFCFHPVGFVAGGNQCGPPIDVAFLPRCGVKVGAVLATAWANGDVTFTQCFFKPTV